MYEVNQERILQTFCELTSIDSLSFDERSMADELKKRLTSLGLTVEEDNAGAQLGGNAGNIIAVLKGNSLKPSILFSCHMDTVMPGNNKRAIIDGNKIHTDGSTILGGDDVSGITCILEMLHQIEEKNLKHGDIFIVFTVAEEMGLQGAKHLDVRRIPADFGFVLDDLGNAGEVIATAPGHVKITGKILGKSVHAGVEPENGINAIEILSEAICHMDLGRIDHETTANIGMVKGGIGMNTVCGEIEFIGEVRSINEKKIQNQLAHIRTNFERAAQKYGGQVEFNEELLYSAVDIEKHPDLKKIIEEACTKIDVPLVLKSSGGGSDGSIFNGSGIPTVTLATAFFNPHGTNEYVLADEMIKLSKLVLAIIQNV